MSTPTRFGVRSVRFRIVILFIAALLALFAALGFLVWQQNRTAASLQVITRSYLPLSNVAALLDRDRQRVANDLERLLRAERRPGTGATSPTAIYNEAFTRNLTAGRSHADEARRLAPTAAERAALHKVDTHLDRIEGMAEHYQELSQRFVVLAERGDVDEAAELMGLLRKESDNLGTEIEQLVRTVDERVSELTEATEADQARGLAVAAIMSVVAIGFATGLVGALMYALRPIGILTLEVQRLAAGERIGPVEVRGRDELSVLAREFNNMAEAIRLRDERLTERADELRRLTRYLSSVVDSLQESLLVVESETVTLANPTARQVWSATTGSNMPEAFVGLASGRHEIRRDGRIYEVRRAPFGEDGALILASDVTVETSTRERLVQSERLALIGQMLAQITHEVRNPLNALSLNAELMGDELQQLDGEHQSEAWVTLRTISGEIDRLTAVTGHYLQLARRPPAHLEPADLRGVAEDVVRLIRPELEQQDVDLTLNLDDVGPQLADGNQLRQALLNVVRNAVEAGAHKLEVRLHRVQDEVLLSLEDDGPGMSQEQVARAAEPFWSSKAQGTGLGLAITKQILEDHGGALRVDSKSGEGTTVTLVLPHTVQLEESDVPHHPGRG